MFTFILFSECGSSTFTYTEDKEDCPLEITLVGWKGKNSIRSYVMKIERLHYLRLLGVDVSSFERNKFEEQRQLEAQQKAEEEKKMEVSNKE